LVLAREFDRLHYREHFDGGGRERTLYESKSLLDSLIVDQRIMELIEEIFIDIFIKDNI
jgi:hypothetical protein